MTEPSTRLRRQPPAFRQVHVSRTVALTPYLVRATFAGAELEGLAVDEPAASVRLLLPSAPGGPLLLPTWNGNEFRHADGTRPLLRTYTPRRWDPVQRELDIDIVLHPSGAAATWAAEAAPGAPAAISGPGRGYVIDETATSMLLAGDETALPAIAQLLEVIPPSTSVTVLAEIAHPDARLELPPRAATEVRWLDLPPGDEHGAALVDGVRSSAIAPETVIWAAGEAAAVQAIRRHLFEDLGLSRRQATVRGYWKRGRRGAPDD